jgi:hypothetical protein
LREIARDIAKGGWHRVVEADTVPARLDRSQPSPPWQPPEEANYTRWVTAHCVFVNFGKRLESVKSVR